MNIRKPSLKPSLTLLSLPIVGLCMLVSPSVASPLVSIGESADVYFNGASSLRWSSNIFRNENNESDDLIWTLSPGFEINVGRGQSNADLSIVTRYDILRYEDNDQLDTEQFHIKAFGSYRSSRLDLNGSISFDEEQSNSGDSNLSADLIETDTTSASLNAEYRFSPKLSLGSGVSFYQREYQAPYDDRFSDRERVSVPVDLFYELTPKIDLSIGYKYDNTDVGETYIPSTLLSTLLYTSDYETSGHFFNIGARGNLLPKVTGFFKIGYRVRENEDSQRVDDPFGDNVALADTNREDSGTLGLDANFTWEATPKITTFLNMSRDFGVGGEGQSTEETSIDLGATYSISPSFSANANLGYTLRDYTNSGREDNQYTAGLGLSYSPNQYWRFGTGYSYIENDSDSASRSYEDHSVNVSATLRY